MSEPAEIAAKLTKAQRWRVLSFGVEPRQMGVGMSQFLPGLVKAGDDNHPIFGPHYSLTPLGLAVRDHLLKESDHVQ